MPDYIPRGDAGFAVFSRNFLNHIARDPSAFGLPEELAARIEVCFDGFEQAWKRVGAVDTRTGLAVKAKDAKRRDLESVLREAVRVMRADPGRSVDPLLLSLELRPRTTPRRRVPRPDVAPRLTLVGGLSTAVRVDIWKRTDGQPVRGKPKDMLGTLLYACIGAAPPDAERRFLPDDPGLNSPTYGFVGGRGDAWTFIRLATSGRADIRYSQRIPVHSILWVTGCYVNPTGEPGPAARPVGFRIPMFAAIEDADEQGEVPGMLVADAA